MMRVLYGMDNNTINCHMKKEFGDSGLEHASVIRKVRTTASDGKSDDTQHYKPPSNIALGHRVNSQRPVQFRNWAAGIIEQFTIQAHSTSEFEKYCIVQDRFFESDFDRLMNQIESGGTPGKDKG
jgi:hypothetical protein